MKNIILALIVLISTSIFAQDKNAKTFLEVHGICGMCKSRIEKACLNVRGVKFAEWNIDTHELKLIYNERKTHVDSIKTHVLDAGHDVGNERAADEAYEKVHECCRYRREDVKMEHEKTHEE